MYHNNPTTEVKRMINIVCDACKKTIRDAQKDVTVFFVTDKSLCYPCKEKLDDQVKNQMFKAKEYGFKKHQDTYVKTLNSMCK